MEVFETWDIDVSMMQYDNLRKAFEKRFEFRENTLATRHRFLKVRPHGSECCECTSEWMYE